jgi:hypothetical protein
LFDGNNTFRRASGGFLSPLASERSALCSHTSWNSPSKSGKAKELSKTIDEKALPILKKQGGFVDETVLVSDRNQIEF